MKNLFKFFLLVALLSLAISALYDYRLKHGGLKTAERTPEKYTLADSPTVDPKQIVSLEALNRERRALVSSVVPSVVAVKTTKKNDKWWLTLEQSKDDLKNAPGFKYDKASTTWVPDKK